MPLLKLLSVPSIALLLRSAVTDGDISSLPEPVLAFHFHAALGAALPVIVQYFMVVLPHARRVSRGSPSTAIRIALETLTQSLNTTIVGVGVENRAHD